MSPKPQTSFPDDLPIDSARAYAYHASRQRVAGLTVVRWIEILLVVSGLLWAIRSLPARWIVPLLLCLVAVEIGVAIQMLQRQLFVKFIEHETPEIVPQAIAPADKIPVYVSGLLGVQGRRRAFVGLPGFYRTFPTREHALMCQVRPRRWFNFAGWPDEEVGLWYAFFNPDELVSARAGVLRFDRQERLALAINYNATLEPGKQGQRANSVPVTLYLAFADDAARAAVLSDLVVDSRLVEPISTQS